MPGRRRRIGAQRGSAQEGEELKCTVLQRRPSAPRRRATTASGCSARGLRAMYVPVYWWAELDLADRRPPHGALILGVWPAVLGLREKIDAWSRGRARLAGRSSASARSESSPGVRDLDPRSRLAAGRRRGILLLLKGPAATGCLVRALLLHLHDPAAGIIVDAVTGPLKRWISLIVVELLYRSAIRSRQRRDPRDRQYKMWSPTRARDCTRCTACRRSALFMFIRIGPAGRTTRSCSSALPIASSPTSSGSSPGAHHLPLATRPDRVLHGTRDGAHAGGTAGLLRARHAPGPAAVQAWRRGIGSPAVFSVAGLRWPGRASSPIRRRPESPSGRLAGAGSRPAPRPSCRR